MSCLKQAFAAATLLAAPALSLAEGAAPPAGPSGIANIVFILGFVVIFYFLIWRPQAKRAKEHKALMSDLNKGDEVITTGGLAGRIVKVTDDFILLEVADNVQLKVQKVAVTAALPKGTLKAVE